MISLLLSPPKVISRTDPERWKKGAGVKTILLTGADSAREAREFNHRYEGSFHSIGFFPKYHSNDLPLLRASELVREHSISKIVAMSEVDVMRAAALRTLYELPGLQLAESVFFRDKIKMKQKAMEAGVRVAEHARVRNALDLQGFITKRGFPIILKPISGRGSLNTHVVNSQEELNELLNRGVISDTDRNTELLVESFVPGDLHRIDGYYANGNCAFISAAKYIGTHLDYLGGGYLGSVILDAESRVARELVRFTKDLLERVLPFGCDGFFHVEVFVTPSGQLVLGEAAARLGGGSINEEIETAFGVDIKTEGVRAFTDPTAENGSHISQRSIAGQLHISPQAGRLLSLPVVCPFPWVTRYEAGVTGRIYSPMTYTNAEVASFVFSAESEVEAELRLQILWDWYTLESKWEIVREPQDPLACRNSLASGWEKIESWDSPRAAGISAARGPSGECRV